MSTVKISELALISQLNANTSNTLFVAVDVPTGVTGKFTGHTLAQGLYSNEVLNVGVNPNTLRWQATDGTIIRTSTFTGGKTLYNASCGTINVQVPALNKAPQAYTYFVSEVKKDKFLYYASESKPPIYI